MQKIEAGSQYTLVSDMSRGMQIVDYSAATGHCVFVPTEQNWTLLLLQSAS